MTDGRKALLLARGILLECGRELMRRRMESLGEVEEKTGYDDVVTPNDRWAQDFICGRLLERFPSHGVLGEEGARKKGESPWLWVLDPIDGTTNFIHLGKLYAISLGLYYGGKPYGGLVLDVEQGRVYEGLEKPVSLPRGEVGQCRRSLLHLGYKTMEHLAAMGSDPLALPRQFRGVR